MAGPSTGLRMSGEMVKPAGPSTGLRMSGRVTLTPLGLSQLMAERPSTLRQGSGQAKLGTSGEEKPKRSSKRALAARLAAQRREDAVVAPQRPVLDRAGPSTVLGTGFNSYLRTGSF